MKRMAVDDRRLPDNIANALAAGDAVLLPHGVMADYHDKEGLRVADGEDPVALGHMGFRQAAEVVMTVLETHDHGMAAKARMSFASRKAALVPLY